MTVRGDIGELAASSGSPGSPTASRAKHSLTAARRLAPQRGLRLLDVFFAVATTVCFAALGVHFTLTEDSSVFDDMVGIIACGTITGCTLAYVDHRSVEDHAPARSYPRLLAGAALLSLACVIAVLLRP